VFDELGLAVDPAADVGTLSGGQAARVGLAALLLARFDVLLLDEPTNDLDFAGLAALERWVDATPAGLVVVSHDRTFLERTVTAVLELEEHSRQGALFRGGWASYTEERARARRHAEEAYTTYTGQRDELASRAQRQREWSAKGIGKAKRSGETDKFIKHLNAQSSEQLAGKARRTERQMERLTKVDKPWEGWDLRFTIASAGRSGDRVVELAGVVVRRSATGFRLGPVDLHVGVGERVAITGANGSGKSTLLAVVLGQLAPEQGSRVLGPGVRLGVIGQQRDRFAGAPTLLEAFVAGSGQTTSEARSVLAKFGVGADHVVRPSPSLSPGERTRAELALLQATGVNCLVLDEPSNHLDLPAVGQLEQALDQFDGTLLLVTHDRQLLDAVRLSRTVELSGGQVVADRPAPDAP
jgi:ATPase subunit of ABC transporter with duplicated ATPase domains